MVSVRGYSYIIFGYPCQTCSMSRDKSFRLYFLYGDTLVTESCRATLNYFSRRNL
jgi:hypothetical protein